MTIMPEAGKFMLHVIKSADWIIDLGSEGIGGGGGEVVAVGTPEQVAAHPASLYEKPRRSNPSCKPLKRLSSPLAWCDS